MLTTLENKLGSSHNQLSLLKHNLDPAPHVTWARIKEQGLVSSETEHPEMGLWHEYESRRYALADDDHQLQDGIIDKKLNNIQAETYVTALGGAIPHDMFPANNFSHLAPPAREKSHTPDPAAHMTSAGKNKGKKFELPDDTSPPESLMVQREDD